MSIKNPLASNRMKILFWNIGTKSLTPEITKLISRYRPDIFIVAESTLDDATTEAYINKFNGNQYSLLPKNKRGISFIINKKIRVKNITFSLSKIHAIEVTTIKQKYLICGIHMDSKLQKTSEDQEHIARNLMREITNIEKGLGHTNTVVIGDFNMNPFESGMVNPDTFNAVSSKKVAERGNRKVSETNSEHLYFYNPMWSFLGDMSEFSPGTYYFRDNSHKNNFVWNMYDQILVRPQLLCDMDSDCVEIVEMGNIGVNLSPRAGYQTIAPSDHLPIFVQLK